MHSPLSVVILLVFSTNVARAQVKVPVQECGLKSLQVCALHVAQDEVGIITAPFHLSAPSYYWLLPFGAATGIALDTDNEAMQAVGFDTSRQNEFRRISDYGGLYGPSASVAVGYIAGSVTHNGHLQQTAVLAAEAMADSIILNTGLGYAIDRQTPMQGNGRGDFLVARHQDVAGWAVDALRSLHPGMVLCPRRRIAIQRHCHPADRLLLGHDGLCFESDGPRTFSFRRLRGGSARLRYRRVCG